MDYNSEKNTITLFGKNEKLDTLATRLASLSGEQVYSLFVNRGIAIPRKMNCMALTSVINERLKTLHASELSRDYFQRLKFYDKFSETQLYNLFNMICKTSEYFKQYRINLFKLILINFVGLNLTDGEVKYLKDLKKLRIESFEYYFQYISSMCQEQENTFDGQDMNVLRDMLVESASGQEIIELASKYGIELSTSLKKNEFVEYIKYYLSKAGELGKALEYEIDASTVAGLNTICKKYRIPMSSNMSKNDLVTYLFYILNQCEITITSVRRIEMLDIYKPLEFEIDMDTFKGFLRDDTKRVILYEGMENDEFPPLEKEVDPFLEIPAKESAEESFGLFEEGQDEPTNEALKSYNPKELREINKNKNMDDPYIEEQNIQSDDAEGDIIYVDEDGNPIEVEFEDDRVEYIEIEEAIEEVEEEPAIEEEIVDLEEAVAPIQEEVVEAPAVEEAPALEEKNSDSIAKEEPKQVDKNRLPMDDVRENKEFGNDKLMKAANGPARKIIFTILGIIGFAAIIFVVWALLFG